MKPFRAIAVLALLLASAWDACGACSDCPGSAGYVTITVDAAKVDEAIPYFAVYLSDLPADFHSAMDTAGDTTGESIRVTTSDGATECAIFVVNVDTGANTGMVIAEAVGVSASVNTAYRVYAGNPSATMYAETDTYGQYAVFPADIVAFYPLCGPQPLENAAQDAYHLSVNGSPTSGNAGPFEGTQSYDFSGSGQYLYVNTTPVSNWPVDIYGFFRSDSATASQTIASVADTANSNDYAVLEAAGSITTPVADPIRLRSFGDGGSERIAATSSAYSTSTWTFAEGSRNGTSGTTYARINAGSAGSSGSTVADASFENIGIAVARRSSLTNYFDGRLSLITYANVAHSANYVTSIYNAFADSAFYTAGAWTSNSTTGHGWYYMRRR